MANYAQQLMIASVALMLAGCSSSNDGKAGDCLYFQDSANLFLDAYFELESTRYPMITNPQTGKLQADYLSIRIKKQELIQLQKDWANRVLNAPKECFPESEIQKARSYLD